MKTFRQFLEEKEVTARGLRYLSTATSDLRSAITTEPPNPSKEEMTERERRIKNRKKGINRILKRL